MYSIRTAHWALYVCSGLIFGSFDKIDVRVVTDNGPNEIVYFPEDFNILEIVFNHVVNTV
jgi:hypothetical protein